MQGNKILSKSHQNSSDSFDQIKSMSLLKFYAEYYEYIGLKYSIKYLKSITTLFNHLFNYFGRERVIHEIDFREWDRFFLHLLTKCPGGVPVYLRTLKAALNKALEWNFIFENSVKKIKLPKRQHEEQRSLNVDELNEILDVVNNQQIKDLIKTAFYTGLRRSELIKLKVKHVDLRAGFLKVGDEEFITKSRRIREVALSLQVIQLLKNTCVNKKPEDLLFGKSDTFPYTADYITRIFKKAVKRKQLDNRIHFHSCRHSYI